MIAARIPRMLPPAAAPLAWADLWHGAGASFRPEYARQARVREICREFGVRYAFLVSSGSAALTLALTTLKDLSSRTEVIIPAYTCFSVPAAILQAGLRPVPCDIDESTFDFNHDLLRRALSPRTLCVVAHHLFGIPSDVERLRTLCRANGTFVIEDAAQAMGVEAGGRKLGTLGDIGIFSLGRGKHITCGSGGVLVTSRTNLGEAAERQYRSVRLPRIVDEAADAIRLLMMALFVRPRLFWIPASLPFLHLGETIFPKRIPIRRLSGVKAGLLRGWRSRLNRSNRLRSETAKYFGDRLPLRLPAGADHPYLRLPLVLGDAGEKLKLCRLSRERGLGLSAAYPAPVNDIPDAPIAGDRDFPCARRVAAGLVTIPTHHLVTEADKAAIVELCRDFGGRNG